MTSPTADGQGWRPIETAPRDGTRIHLYYPEYAGTYPEVFTYGKWDMQPYNKRPIPYWDAEHLSVFGVRYLQGRQPTHWMPLPSPPTSGEGA